MVETQPTFCFGAIGAKVAARPEGYLGTQYCMVEYAVERREVE